MGRTLRVKAALSALAALGMAAGVASADPLVVSPTTGAGMVSNLVGGGITVTSGSIVYTGASGAAGTFTGGTGILPFDSGIVLSSGSATGVVGPNTVGNFSVTNNTAGDAQLGANTHDAAVLEFDFTTANDVMSFQFVFGSEEYNEFAPPNSSNFNDRFAFYLNGVNIALLPNSQQITINNVNQITNSAYFTDNTSGALNTQLDGLVGASIPLFATGSVLANQTNHIKIVVADTTDFIYDSAVFIKAGSFVDTDPPPGVPLPGIAFAGMALMGCTGVSKLRRRRTAE